MTLGYYYWYGAPMPDIAVAASTKPPAIQGDVIALFSQGTSKRSIAKELGIDRATVDRILKAYSQNKPISASRVQQLVPVAYDALEKGLKSGDSRLGLDFLKATDLAPDKSDQWHVMGDVVQQHLTLLPSASTTATASTPSTSDALATEAAAKPPQSDMSLSVRKDFLPVLEKFVLHLANEMPQMQSGTSGGSVLPQPELLQALRETARKFMEQQESSEHSGRVLEVEVLEPGAGQGTPAAAKLTPVLRADRGTIR